MTSSAREPSLPDVMEAFADYVKAVVNRDDNVDACHALAHQQAHAYLQLLIQLGELEPDGYQHRFLLLVSRIFEELATRNPDDREWLNLCLLRSDVMVAASSLASPHAKRRRRPDADQPEPGDDAAVSPPEPPQAQHGPLLSATLARQRKAARRPPGSLSEAQLAQRRAAGHSRSRHPRQRASRTRAS